MKTTVCIWRSLVGFRQKHKRHLVAEEREREWKRERALHEKKWKKLASCLHMVNSTTGLWHLPMNIDPQISRSSDIYECVMHVGQNMSNKNQPSHILSIFWSKCMNYLHTSNDPNILGLWSTLEDDTIQLWEWLYVTI